MKTRTKLMQQAHDCLEMVNQALNKKYIFSIDSNWDGIKPSISKTDLTIKYNSKFEISALLLLGGDFTTVLDYWFGLNSFENGSYASSRFFINQLSKKCNHIFRRFKFYKAANSGLLEYMTIFVILHEVAHGIYVHYPKLRESAFSEIDKELSTLINSYNQCDLNKSSLINDLNKKRQALDKLGLISEEVMTKNQLITSSIKELADLDKTSLKEELACDLYSLSVAVQVVEYRGGSKEEYLNFYKASMLALILITRYNYIVRRFIKLQDNERYAMNNDAELIRLQFYNNECLQGLKSRQIYTTFYYDFVKQFLVDYLLDVNKYIEKHLSIIIDSAERHDYNQTDKIEVSSCIEKVEDFIINKYLI